MTLDKNESRKRKPKRGFIPLGKPPFDPWYIVPITNEAKAVERDVQRAIRRQFARYVAAEAAAERARKRGKTL